MKNKAIAGLFIVLVIMGIIAIIIKHNADYPTKKINYNLVSSATLPSLDVEHIFTRHSVIANDSLGNFYVVEPYKHVIKAFDDSMHLLREVGGYGQGPGEYIRPTCVKINNDNSLYVSDKGDKKIIKYGKGYKYLYTIYLNNAYGSINFAVDKNERFYVNTEAADSIITIYDYYGRIKSAFGKKLEPGKASIKSVKNEASITIDGENNIWVCFHYAPIIRKYTSSGTLLFEAEIQTPVNIETRREEDAKKGKMNAGVFSYFDDIISCRGRIFIANHYNIVEINPYDGNLVKIYEAEIPKDSQKYNFIYKISYSKMDNCLKFISQYDGNLYSVNGVELDIKY